MESESKKIKINTITKDFNRKVQELITNGTPIEDIIFALKWNKSSFSLVRNNKRNVPTDKYDLLKTVFVFENDGQEPKLKTHEEIVEAATVKMLFHEVAKIKAKVFSQNYEDCLTELEQNTISIIKDMRSSQL